MPKVTVLMAVFNAEKYLNEAIESILNQTFSNLEFLIIYDKSQDKTLEILKSYSDPRLRIIENEERLGFVKSLNKGLSLAEGEFIARMDADDISLPKRLAIQLDYFDSHPFIDFVCSSISVMDETGCVIDYIADISSSDEIYYTLNFRNCIAHGSVMFRKSIIDLVGNYEESCAAEDYNLWHRISKKYVIHKIDQPLYGWRTHKTSISSVNSTRLREAAYGIFRANLINLLGRNVEGKLTRLVWDNFCNTHYADLNDYSYKEIATIAELIRELNIKIVNTTPPGLSKRVITDLGNEKYMRYLFVTGRKMGLFKTLELINSIDENSIYKVSIIRKLINNFIKSTINKKDTRRNY